MIWDLNSYSHGHAWWKQRVEADKTSLMDKTKEIIYIKHFKCLLR